MLRALGEMDKVRQLMHRIDSMEDTVKILCNSYTDVSGEIGTHGGLQAAHTCPQVLLMALLGVEVPEPVPMSPGLLPAGTGVGPECH